MREKELRLALVCYGGISLAVYMHGITTEIWRLARASRAFTAGEAAGEGCEGVYADLLAAITEETDLKLRVLVDIVAGASAGGLNGIFLAQAIATGRPLDPLTRMWLDKADIEELIDPDARPGTRFSKMWAMPIAWAAAGREAGLEETVEPSQRAEVKHKLAAFVRARWFEPPFGGAGFTRIILDALDAIAAQPAGPPLLPEGQPLDLFVTVTDFRGHPERLRLHSPAEVIETEHRLTIAFTDHGRAPRELADGSELAFAARATASFPGAFPPFAVGELDAVLEARNRRWPGREAFLARVLPRHFALGTAEQAVLIDGSVLANAPFRPAVEALRNRPARREVDRRFVYIDPSPGRPFMRFGRHDDAAAPGFFATIFGAISEIPRTQPIRDNLDEIARRSLRIDRLRGITEAIRPEVERAVEEAIGSTLFLSRPTPARLLAWRAKAQDRAAKAAGYAYASYGHLKLTAIAEELAQTLRDLAAPRAHHSIEAIRDTVEHHIAALGLRGPHALSADGASGPAIRFFRSHDLGFRIRRLRFLVRRIEEMEQAAELARAEAQGVREALFAALAPYVARAGNDFYDEPARAAARIAPGDPAAALDWIADTRNLKALDKEADAMLAEAFAGLPKGARRPVLLAYLGFPFYDIATLPLLRGEESDEFDPVKVDRISPEDAQTIRAGGAEATLKGIQFNSFGAFFSRAYRENDYLWGRLHAADRLIDIVASALPAGSSLAPGRIATLKRAAFRAIVTEERPRLTAITDLFERLDDEIG